MLCRKAKNRQVNLFSGLLSFDKFFTLLKISFERLHNTLNIKLFIMILEYAPQKSRVTVWYFDLLSYIRLL